MLTGGFGSHFATANTEICGARSASGDSEHDFIVMGRCPEKPRWLRLEK
jgi:hypothetical protein